MTTDKSERAEQPETLPAENTDQLDPQQLEIARFKALTLSRAKKQAAVQRLIARFQPDEQLADAA